MFSHIMVGSNDIARSKKFYDALFVAMGAQPGVEDARGRLAYTQRAALSGRPSHCASAVSEPIAEPNRAALQHLAAGQRH